MRKGRRNEEDMMEGKGCFVTTSLVQNILLIFALFVRLFLKKNLNSKLTLASNIETKGASDLLESSCLCILSVGITHEAPCLASYFFNVTSSLTQPEKLSLHCRHWSPSTPSC